MKRSMKWLILLVLVLLAFFVYKFTYHTKYNYVYFGNNDLYGSYVIDSLKENNKLGKYYFSDKFNTISSLKDAIDNNIIIDDYSIRRILREADIVNIYIDSGELLKLFNDKTLDSSNDNIKYYKKIDQLVLEIKSMLLEVKKYAKKDIILIGYYDSFKYIDYSDGEFNLFIKYINHQLENACDDLSVNFINLDKLLDKKEYFIIKDKAYISDNGRQIISNEVLSSLH